MDSPHTEGVHLDRLDFCLRCIPEVIARRSTERMNFRHAWVGARRTVEPIEQACLIDARERDRSGQNRAVQSESLWLVIKTNRG